MRSIQPVLEESISALLILFDLAVSVGSKITQVIPISIKESRCLHILSAKRPVLLGLLQIDYVKLFMNDHLYEHVLRLIP